MTEHLQESDRTARPIGYEITRVWCRRCAPEAVADGYDPIREDDGYGVYHCDDCGEVLRPCELEPRQCPKCGGRHGYTSSHGWLCFSCPIPEPAKRACAECGVPVRPGDGGVRAFGLLFCSELCADCQDPAFIDEPLPQYADSYGEHPLGGAWVTEIWVVMNWEPGHEEPVAAYVSEREAYEAPEIRSDRFESYSVVRVPFRGEALLAALREAREHIAAYSPQDDAGFYDDSVQAVLDRLDAAIGGP